MMSVLPLPTDSFCLVLMVDRMQGFNLRRHNNADVFFSYSVTKENISIIKPTEIETLHSSLLTVDSSDLSVTGVRTS